MIYRFSITVLKILFASLVVGFALSTLNITAEQVMTEVGLSPERALAWTQHAIAWAVPHLLLGSMVIISAMDHRLPVPAEKLTPPADRTHRVGNFSGRLYLHQ